MQKHFHARLLARGAQPVKALDAKVLFAFPDLSLRFFSCWERQLLLEALLQVANAFKESHGRLDDDVCKTN